MNDTASAESTARPHMARWRIVVLAIFLLLSAGAVAYARLSEEVATTGATTAFTILAVLATLFLLFVWLVLFSGFALKRRLWAGAAVLAVGMGLRAMVRVEGFHGDILPIFTWRWAPKHDYTLPALPAQAADAPKDAAPVEAGALDFSQFLGAKRDGVVPDDALAKEWWRGPFVEKWRRPTGAGWSGWVTAGPYAYTQEQRGASELVVCVKLASGEGVWSHAGEARFSETMGGDGPRATPTLDGGNVYALGATGILNCLDAATGKPRWSKNVLAESGHPNLEWGKASSPLVHNGLVYVTLGASSDKSTAAYRADDGTLAWRAGADEASYSSPVIATLAGREQLVVFYKESVAGHDPATGATLWTHEWKGGPAKVATPLFAGNDTVFVSAGYGLGCRMLKIERDGETFGAKLLWKNLQLKTKFTNAVIVDGHAYGLDEGRLACVKLDDGARAWKGESYGQGQLLAAGRVLLVQEESGGVALVAADPAEEKLLGRIDALKAKTWNYPCVSGRTLLVRNDRETICFELPGK